MTIVDAPSHPWRIPASLEAGNGHLDCGLLVLDSRIGEFEASFSKGGQGRKHVTLLLQLGVKQLIVAVNKMDSTKPPYSQARFEAIQKEVSGIIEKVKLLPISAQV